MGDLTERHEGTQNARALFATDHLTDPGLLALSSRFTEFADMLIAVLPDDPMLRESLIKLWESKNSAMWVAARVGYQLLPDIPLPPAGFGTTTPHTRET